MESIYPYYPRVFIILLIKAKANLLSKGEKRPCLTQEDIISP
jgi:hypothetical protein